MCLWEEPVGLEFGASLSVEEAKRVIVTGARNGNRGDKLATETLVERSPF